jgi:hypothetical protein
MRQSLNWAPGVLIGSAIATPAFAASNIALDELRLPILLGSGVLLAIALALKVKNRRATRTQAPVPQTPAHSNGFNEGIGRYRLQFGRGGAN